MREIRGSDEPLDTDALARRTGLHRNTVRFHLRVLTEAGLVRHRSEGRGVAGRPRHVYAVTPEGDQVEDDPHYKLLAGAFATFLASGHGPAGAQRGEPVGRLLGRSLARDDRTRAIPSSKAARQVNDLLTDMGFESELHVTRKSYRLMLHHCPFNDLAVEHKDVICGLHLGLLKQVLEQTNTPAMTVSLQPFVTPKLCVAELVKPGADAR